MRKIVLFIGVVFIALVTTAQEYIYIIEKDSHYLQEKVAVAVSDVDSISFVAPNECMENGYEWVDLGLPSGVKWATCNVGATKPEEYGNYYAWGETEPKTTYNWSTYKWCNGSGTTLTKYNTDSDYGTVDDKTVLDPEDDAARANWGGAWRMPTNEELEELRINCAWTWTDDYNGTGVDGQIVTSRKNGNSIFLPTAGYYSDKYAWSPGGFGEYWSSSLRTGDPKYGAGNPKCAWEASLCKFWDDASISPYSSRCGGQSVRPVLGE